MPGTFSEYAPYTQYVQSGMTDGRYANASVTMLAAGPPRLANIGGAAALAGALNAGGQAAGQIVFPVGLVQNFNLSQTKQVSRLFEIGSERSYHISGRTIGQVGLGRVYYHGASLLRVLYAYYQDLVPPTLVPAMFPNAGTAAMSNPHDVRIAPGYENIFINLASDLFTQPVGLLLYIRDINLDTLAATYLEACFIPNHTWATDAQGVLIQESVALQYERLVPVAVSALTLITTGNASGANLGASQQGISSGQI